jgi:hypothetical protein
MVCYMADEEEDPLAPRQAPPPLVPLAEMLVGPEPRQDFVNLVGRSRSCGRGSR